MCSVLKLGGLYPLELPSCVHVLSPLVLEHPRSSSWVLCCLRLGEWELCLLWILAAFIAETELCTWTQFSQTQGSGLPLYQSVANDSGKNMDSGLVLLWALPYLSNQLIHYSVWLSAPYRMDSQCGQQDGFWWLQCTSHLQAEWFQFFECTAACEQHAFSVVWRWGGAHLTPSQPSSQLNCQGRGVSLHPQPPG